MLTSRPAPWSMVALSYAVFALVPVWAARRTDSGEDNLIIVRAARRLLSGISPYADLRFVYPPSSLPFALVQARVPDGILQNLSPFVCAALILVAWYAALRLFDVSPRSWLGILPVGAAALFAPFVNVVVLGSWTAAVAALAAVALLLMKRDRWVLAGLVVGLSIAVKPMLVPFGLLFLLQRRWGGFALAAGVPAVLAAVMFLVIPEPQRFFSETIPFLLGGQDDYARPYDTSLVAILPRVGVDGVVVTVLRVVVGAAVLVVVWVRWHQNGRDDLRLTETAALLMLGTFLISSPGFDHYSLVVLPTLLASAAVPGSAPRTAWFWLALIPQTGAVRIQELDPQQARAFKDFFMFAVLLTGLSVTALLARRTQRQMARVAADREGAAPR